MDDRSVATVHTNPNNTATATRSICPAFYANLNIILVDKTLQTFWEKVLIG